jgi:hydroxymethylpyrimidine kinase/phosphomethylpyrimidine kinase
MMIVMTIAGFDPSAGAGTLADIKTMSAFGCYGVAVITSLTFQNTQGVYGAATQAQETVTRQLDALFDDFQIAAIKTGMLPTAEIIAAVAERLARQPIEHLVVDPVVRSTSGYDLIDDVALKALMERLIPLASVVTPNKVEAERMTGVAIHNLEDMEKAAGMILTLGAQAVLVKGGDLEGDAATDLLMDAGGPAWFTEPRVESTNTHGTGCTLSSALACLLGLGYPLRQALPIAKRYIVEAIRHAPQIGKGHGPLNHFPPEFGVD